MEMTLDGIKGKVLEYKGLPLVRQDNELYYGSMDDKFILFLMIMTEKEDEKTKATIPGKVMVQIIPTDGSHRLKNRVWQTDSMKLWISAEPGLSAQTAHNREN